VSEGHQRYLEVKLGSLLTQALDEHSFPSGKCVYQADSSHSILSDVCRPLLQLLSYLYLSVFSIEL
jgi:hypothetical protein